MDHDSKPLCTQMAAKVCYKLQVVVHDLQGASEGAQDSLTLGLTLGMLLASRVVHFWLQMISMEVLWWMS